METLVNKLLDVFSLEYMFSVIVATYFVLKIVDAFNGDRAIPTWAKRLCTLLIGAVLFGVFIKFTDTSVQCLTASFFAAIFVYDIAIKELIKKVNLDYKK